MNIKKNRKYVSCAFLLCTSVLFVALISACANISKVNPYNSNDLDQGMQQSLSTLKRLDKDGKLYEIDISNDYYNEASQKIIDEEKFQIRDFGCTAFMTHNENGDVITGRNFDTNHKAKNLEDSQGVFVAYHCHLDGCYKSVAFSDAKYFNDEMANCKPGSLDDKQTDISGVINGIYDPLDGMNEKGLTASTLYSDTRKDEQGYSVREPNKNTIVTGLLIRYILDKCATVDEAVELSKNYNIMPYSGKKGIEHILLTDANGKSIVIEWRNNEMRVADTDISTNFYQTWQDPEPYKVKLSKEYDNDSQLSKTYKNYKYGYGHGYGRFNIVASAFQQYAEYDENHKYYSKMSDELARNLLSIVAQQYSQQLTSMTQYSTLYNNSNLTTKIWLSRDYDNYYEFGIDYK